MSRVLKHRVLVVDDDESVREVLALLLRKEGYEVATAENGFDTLLKPKGVVIPDVIISDLNMLEMSGFEFPSGVRRRFPQDFSNRQQRSVWKQIRTDRSACRRPGC